MCPVRVPVLENVGCDLDQERVQLRLVPAVEHLSISNVASVWSPRERVTRHAGVTHLCHFVLFHAEHVLHQVIRLTDELHVAVLDAVMDHFHKMTRTLITHLPRQNSQIITGKKMQIQSEQL